MEVISAGVADIGTERSLGPFQVTVMNTTDGITSIISTSATGAMDGNLLTCINVGAGGDNSRSVTLDVVQSKCHSVHCYCIYYRFSKCIFLCVVSCRKPHG